MTSILLAAALAASPDSLPPPTPPSVIRDTVYIERVITERAINPEAGVTATRSSPAWLKDALGIAGMATGAYLFVDGMNDRQDENSIRRLLGFERRSSWSGQMTIGTVVFIAGVAVAAAK